MINNKEITLENGITVTVYSNGEIYKDGKRLKEQTLPTGYKYVNINAAEHYLIHRLVASAFIQPLRYRDRSLHVHHIDGNKTNNNLSNLEIISMAEHQRMHKQKYPLTKICEVCGKEFTPHPTKRQRAKTCSYECWRKLCGLKNEKRKKKIRQIDIKTHQTIRIWDSFMDIERTTGFFAGNIHKCCNHIIHTYKGYIWEYDEPKGDKQ